jgi:NAD(P)H-hydrate repair Nnr-like enzyme with NAD(P)H-hydrate dehydratase domain
MVTVAALRLSISRSCGIAVISALCGQGLSDFDAAVLGVYIHGLAGDLAAEKRGQISLIATDIIEAIPNASMRA